VVVIASNVYAYGTLQEPDVFRLIVGRSIAAAAAMLEDHARFRLRNEVYPAIVAQAGQSVAGLLYAGVTAAELARLDEYEGRLFERKELWVSSAGTPTLAFTYVLRERERHLLSAEPWDIEQFRREHLASYLRRIALTARAP
jgi:gamma-glutamylcyclotransferase (GGCT)/AIG2-like uncharacterized protein YtfP